MMMKNYNYCVDISRLTVILTLWAAHECYYYPPGWKMNEITAQGQARSEQGVASVHFSFYLPVEQDVVRIEDE
jgi:hypothetical protein